MHINSNVCWIKYTFQRECSYTLFMVVLEFHDQSKIKKISRPLIALVRPSKIDYVISGPNLESWCGIQIFDFSIFLKVRCDSTLFFDRFSNGSKKNISTFEKKVRIWGGLNLLQADELFKTLYLFEYSNTSSLFTLFCNAILFQICNKLKSFACILQAF